MTVKLDIPGLSVGHFSDLEGMTGCTVVLCPEGVTASVDIRGGAPGTLDTDLLAPLAAVSEVHAILLTGGSAPGLGAAAGVTCYLREQGMGYQTAFARIPLVSGAVIYDLGLGSADACPTPEDGYAAAASAGTVVEEGSVGVGTAATVGKILGRPGLMKGGVGVARVQVSGGVSVTVLTVVNALGDVMDEEGRVLAGARRGGAFVNSQRHLLQMADNPLFNHVENTTLAVVMTDARLDKAQCAMVARMSHDGMARAIEPVHTPVDGDCMFALATGRYPSNVFQVGAAAAEAVAAAIRRAVRLAQGCPGALALSELPTLNQAPDDSGQAAETGATEQGDRERGR